MNSQEPSDCLRATSTLWPLRSTERALLMETVFGARLYNGTGGQPELHIGAVLSKGGRAITLVRSTAVGGAVSRIAAQHEEGAVT